MLAEPKQLFQTHVPAAAAAYCTTLHQAYTFDFRVSRPRRSKWGDYRYRRSGRSVQHAISVNANLNPYAFLITYLHEVAHLRAFQQHGFRISPHGADWKQCFRQLLVPVLSETVFPPEVLVALRQHARNPRASTGADAALTHALRKHNPPSDSILLHALPDGTEFQFRERIYVKRKVRRTRALCEEVVSQKQYLILETTLVELP